MSRGWVLVLLAGLATWVIKASGPLFLGGRDLSARQSSILALMAPALLAALVASQTFTTGGIVRLDARVAGLVIAALGAWRGFPIPLVVVAAVGVTAALRFFVG